MWRSRDHQGNLIDFWTKVQRETGMQVRYGERLTAIANDGRGGIAVETSKART